MRLGEWYPLTSDLLMQGWEKVERKNKPPYYVFNSPERKKHIEVIPRLMKGTDDHWRIYVKDNGQNGEHTVHEHLDGVATAIAKGTNHMMIDVGLHAAAMKTHEGLASLYNKLRNRAITHADYLREVKLVLMGVPTPEEARTGKSMLNRDAAPDEAWLEESE